MKVLITGGAGFIGSHLVEHYLAKGDEVTIIDNLSSGQLENISAFQTNPRFKFIETDLLTYSDLDKAVVNCELVYHMAAVIGIFRVLKEPIELLKTNIIGTYRLLDTIVKVNAKPRVIIASSSSVYGRSSKLKLSEKDFLHILPKTHSLSGYAISKIADEALGNAFFQMHQLPITYTRFFNVIGPRQTGQYGMVVPRFVKQALKGEPLTVFGDGQQTRSFCDVRDAISAVDIIAQKNIFLGEPVNIGRDIAISINDLAHLVLKISGSKSPIKHIPYEEAYGIDFSDIKQRKPNLSKLKKHIRFKYQWTLEKTIQHLIGIYKR